MMLPKTTEVFPGWAWLFPLAVLTGSEKARCQAGAGTLDPATALL